MIYFDAGGPDDLLQTMVEQGWSDTIADLPRNEQIEFDPYALQTTAAFRVHYPGLEEIERGYPQSRPRSAWRVVLLADGNPLAQLEADENHRPVAIHSGPAKDGIMRAFAIADTLFGTSRVSVAECAALKFCAVAVRGEGQDEAQPVMIPYAPDRTSLPLYEPAPLEKVTERLRALAAEVRTMSDGGGVWDGPSGG